MMDAPQVLIAGAGPCGLLSALLLSRRGIRCTVIERHQGISTHPKAMGVQRRTAEIYRSLGLLGRMMEKDLPEEDLWLTIYLKSLTGDEIGRIPVEGRISPHTPCRAFHCPQTWTEAVLLDALSQETHAEVLFSHEIQGVTQNEDGVMVNVSGAKCGDLSAPWLIAADGAGSFIRRTIGINAVGPGDMGHFLNVHFRADYSPRMKGRNAVLYNAVCPDYAEMFVAVNGSDEWLMHHFLQEGETPDSHTHAQLAQLVRVASGAPEIPVEILGADPWVMSPKVAERFREGRILLTGDAAARLSPAGGLGLNTGLESVHNLTWKLASVVKGQADPSLLDTYEAERLPVALSRMSGANHNAEEVRGLILLGLEAKWDEMSEIIRHSRRAGSGLGEDLGTSYAQGAFVPDGSKSPEVTDVRNDYIPDARPGSRAPHVWLEKGTERVSTIDDFHSTFVLLIYGEDANGDWECAVRESNNPEIRLIRLGPGGCYENRDGSFRECYGIAEGGTVLVRPDGIVAARSVRPPASPSGFLKEVFAKLGYCP